MVVDAISKNPNKIVTLKLESVHKNEIRFVIFNNENWKKGIKNANYVKF